MKNKGSKFPSRGGVPRSGGVVRLGGEFSMKKLPLGIQSFKDIKNGGYVYADKTQFVYNLLNQAKYYFLSRPRRFGKSLLLDTIAEAFSGDKALFEGLYIYDTDFGFEKHPILRLDMSNISNETPKAFKDSLSGELLKRIRSEGLDIDILCDHEPSGVRGGCGNISIGGQDRRNA